MVSYVLNVRVDQFDLRQDVLHLPRISLRAALEAAGHETLLFASRDEARPGYFGTALLGEPVPDPLNEKLYWLPLHNQQPLSRVVTLKELRALGLDEMPFHTYSRPIRKVSEDEHLALVQVGVIPSGFGEEAVQRFDAQFDHGRPNSTDYRALRFEMFDLYGTRCAFLGRGFPSLNGFRYGIDVGHLWPHWAGGPDVIQNALPMSKDVNYQWDQGLISLTNNGDLIIAHQAGKDTRWLFAKCRQVVFPEDPQRWPDVQYLERHRDEIFEKGPDRRSQQVYGGS